MSVMPMNRRELRVVSPEQDMAETREAAQRHLARILEHNPMTAEERRALVIAVGVLAVLDNRR